jgi:7-carboxy-7-deazaguanine synthase
MSSRTININEIFGSTVQGEGPNIGARCIFVRVQNCDYHCKWCDSKHTWGVNKSNITSYEPEELAKYIIAMCKRENCKHVVLTGGNPCLYDFEHVIYTLHGQNIKVDIETQGSIIPEWLCDIDTVVFSPKAPSSGMEDTYDNITQYTDRFSDTEQQIAIKIPVFSDEDIEFARRYADFVNRVDQDNVKMYLSVGNSDVEEKGSIRDRILTSYEELLNKINKSPEFFEHVYILPQLHTLVWGNKQGV